MPVTLSFVPATQADADTIASYLPKPHADGSPIQPSELPASLPGYLINVTAQLKVEGEIVAQGGTFTLGQELAGEGGFTQNGLDGWDLSADSHTAGQTSALGLNMQGITTDQLTKLQDRLTTTQAKLQAGDWSTLNGDLVGGDLLTATIWSYFAMLDSFGSAAQRQNGMIDRPALSYGFFHNVVAPVKTFGVVTSVTFPGVMMDVGHLRHVRVAKDNDRQAWINYNRLRGQQASALESAVPRQMFTDEGTGQKPESISAVTAITAAIAQGQKVFTITQANAATVLPQLTHSMEVMDDVNNAIAAGKEVTISERTIVAGNWRGVGYIIIDPNTGGGAYLISGGANGGFVATGYVLTTLNLFYDGLSSLAEHMKTPVPILQTIVRFIQLAKFFHDIMEKNIECKNSTAIMLSLTFATLFSILLVHATLTLYNPIAAFAMGTAIDQGINWIYKQTPDCAGG